MAGEGGTTAALRSSGYGWSLRSSLLLRLSETQMFHFLAWLIRAVSLDLPANHFLTTSSGDMRAVLLPICVSRAPGEATHTLATYHPLCLHWFHASDASSHKSQPSNADAAFFSPGTTRILNESHWQASTNMRKVFIQITEKFSLHQHQYNAVGQTKNTASNTGVTDSSNSSLVSPLAALS